MFKRIKDQITKLMRKVVSTSFLVIFVIAFVMWFIRKLSREYTTPIEVGVYIEDDFDSTHWTENRSVKVKLMARGDGRDLVYYKIGVGADVKISASQLELTPSGEGELYSISSQSMERALNSVEKKFNVVTILDTISRIVVSEIDEKKVSVTSRVKVDCVEQFIVSGAVGLSLDSVLVRGPRLLLDDISTIYTEPLHFKDVSSSLRGSVALDVPENVISKEKVAKYSANVVGYTEQIFEEQVTCLGTSAELVVPAYVKIKAKVSLGVELDEKDADIEAYVDSARQESTGVVRRVKIKNMPSEVISYSVEPEFVEVYSVN